MTIDSCVSTLFCLGRHFPFSGSAPKFQNRVLELRTRFCKSEGRPENPDALPPGDRGALGRGRAFLPKKRGARKTRRGFLASERRILGQETHSARSGRSSWRRWNADSARSGNGFLSGGNAVRSEETRFLRRGDAVCFGKDAVRSEGTRSPGERTRFLRKERGFLFRERGSLRKNAVSCSGKRGSPRRGCGSGPGDAVCLRAPSNRASGRPRVVPLLAERNLERGRRRAPGGRYHSTWPVIRSERTASRLTWKLWVPPALVETTVASAGRARGPSSRAGGRSGPSSGRSSRSSRRRCNLGRCPPRGCS